MLLTVARQALTSLSHKSSVNQRLEARQLAQVEWLISKIEDLAATRNAAVHTPMSILQDEAGKLFVDPDIFRARTQAVKRLQQKPIEKSWRRIRGDLHVLAIFALALNICLRNPRYGTLPRKPALLSIPGSSREKIEGVALAEDRHPCRHHSRVDLDLVSGRSAGKLACKRNRIVRDRCCRSAGSSPRRRAARGSFLLWLQLFMVNRQSQMIYG